MLFRSLKLLVPAQTTDKLLLLTTGGKVFTLQGDKLPGGRSQGEPVRLMVDIEEGQDILDIFVHRPGAKRLVASKKGDGFVVNEDDLIALTRKGKQVLNLSGPEEARALVPVEGDMVAVVGENRKLLVFKVEDLPVMARGKGVRLQKYKDGGLSDIKTFSGLNGLSWTDSSGRSFVRPLSELAEWIGERASAGRTVPSGFPRNNRFQG